MYPQLLTNVSTTINKCSILAAGSQDTFSKRVPTQIQDADHYS